jgi:hypothetical protein
LIIIVLQVRKDRLTLDLRPPRPLLLCEGLDLKQVKGEFVAHGGS